MRIHVLIYIPCSKLFVDNSFNSPCNICICMKHIYNIYIYINIYIYYYTSSIFGPRMESPTTSSKKCGHVQMINATRHWFFGLGPWPVSKRSREPTGTLAPIRPRDELSKRRVSTTTAEMEVSHQGPAEVPPWETGKLGNSLAMLFSKEKGLAMYLVQFWEWWF